MALHKYEVVWREGPQSQERSLVYFTAHHPKHSSAADALNEKRPSKDRAELAAYSIACEAGTALISKITVTEVGL